MSNIEKSFEINETEWINITNYLISQIREYCAKKSIDRNEFAERLGINSRALERLYSKKSIKSKTRNNRLLSSLEFFKSLSSALEIDIVRLFTEIQLFAKSNSKGPDNILNSIKETYLNQELDRKSLDIFNRIEKNTKNENLLKIGFILCFVKTQSLKIILNVLENDDFKNLSTEDKKILINSIQSIGKLLTDDR